MKSRLLIMPLATLTLGCALLIGNAQDDDVRGAFLSTRPKTTNTNAPRRRRPPRRMNTNSSSTTANANANNKLPGNSNIDWSKTKIGDPIVKHTAAIALGYTLFMRDVNGRAVRIEPMREFRNGDRIRISLEPNIDGYLYVFHTEGDGAPEMIYPDARLEGGENWIEAHVPVDVPSTVETDERLKWFQFYGNAATEHLYVVVTREPLADVPIADTLVSFCSTNKDKCPWHPSAEVWAKIQEAAKADVKIVTSNTAGKEQTEKEQIATTRGLGLDQTAPQPAVIRMSASTSAPVLVTILDLVHK